MSTSAISPNEAFETTIKRALLDSPKTLSYTASKEAQAETKLFMLRSKGYYDIRAYLCAAFALPSSPADFATLYPLEKLDALTKLDKNVYTEIQTALVNVNQHCTTFSRDTMSKFVEVPNAVIRYCDDVAKYIGGKDEYSLKTQLNILSSPSTSEDGVVQASQIAGVILEELAKGATTVKEACARLIQGLSEFETKTTGDKGRVDALYVKFNEGEKPYGKALNAELQTLRDKFIALDKEYKAEMANYDHYVIVASTTPAYLALPFGFIAAVVVAGVYGDKAVKARDAYLKLAAQKLSNTREQDAIQRAINLVTSMSLMLGQTHQHIGEALAAITTLHTMFSRMSVDLNSMAKKAGSISSMTQKDKWFQRGFSKSLLDDVVKDWVEVKALAKDFNDHRSIILIDEKGNTIDAKAH